MQEYFSLNARRKFVEILLSKEPTYLPCEVSNKYICPYIGMICGCIKKFDNKCPNAIYHFGDCVRCGRIFEVGRRNWHGLFSYHYCLRCQCRYDNGCFKENTGYSKYCIEHNYADLCNIKKLYKIGLINKDKLLKMAFMFNDQRLINYIVNDNDIVECTDNIELPATTFEELLNGCEN